MNVSFAKKKGQWKKDCPKLNNKSRKGGYCIYWNFIEYDETLDYSLAVAVSSSGSQTWILDTGCRYYMSPNKDWFFDFKEIDGGVVHTTSENPCKMAKIGSIQLRNHDGATRI
ncbi:hypothetical protein M5689_006893 [Euphorbia peplus]|nr:hypothetical protein M5689_006893 [Euphorbia peplus]